ncbi:MAG: hypothetical protein ACE5NN_04140 [Candidatus Bathyarchaeia archaeon]
MAKLLELEDRRFIPRKSPRLFHIEVRPKVNDIACKKYRLKME